jgi:excisionase family DNA binding protein
MTEYDLKITITGKPMTGRANVARKIMLLLQGYGCQVDLAGDTDEAVAIAGPLADLTGRRIELNLVQASRTAEGLRQGPPTPAAPTAAAETAGGPPKPYTVLQFAKLVGLSKNAVYQMIDRNELPAVRFGKAIRLPRDKCDRLLRGEPV